MNVLRYFLSFLTILLSSLIFAQSNDPVLIRINNDITVTKSEFEYAYKKELAREAMSDLANSQKDIDAFLESYINYKLSITEAREQSLDKTKSFTREYSAYMTQVEKPYLVDTVSVNNLAKEIYNRLTRNKEFSQILISLPQRAILPKDTVEAYKRITNIKESIDKNNGSNFSNLALAFSDDSISRNASPSGYIGWRTSLATPYPIEQFLYNAPLNTISQPIRTNVGYHIIKSQNDRPDRGQINISHILLYYPSARPTKQERDSVSNLAMGIYNELKAGKDFNKLCLQFSQDQQNYDKGGSLGWFGVNRPVPIDFEDVLWSMDKVGEVTLPVEVEYGFHIFKLEAKTDLLPWEVMKDQLIGALEKSDRNDVLVQEKIDLLVKEYPYRIETNTYKELEKIANQYHLSDSLFFEKILPLEEEIILHTGNHQYKIDDFITFMARNPHSLYFLSTDILYYKFNEFILDRLIETKRLDLPNKYPDLRLLSQEFYDGILFFDIMNQNVWNNAQSNSDELQKFYEENIEKYKWDSPKYKGYIIHAKDKKTMKKVKDFIKANRNDDNLSVALDDTFNNDSTRNIIITKGLWTKGDNPYVDRILYKIASPDEIIGYPEVMIEGKLIAKPENIEDVWGKVTADYQILLENQWYEKLRGKYNVEIDTKVLKNIKSDK